MKAAAVVGFLVSLCHVMSVQAALVTMQISVEPDRLLPGLSPVLRISINNSASAAVAVPTRTALKVIPPRGEPFFAYAGLREDVYTMDLPAKRPLVLAPGETRDLTFWSGDDWFAADARFRTTGVFRVQLVVDDRLDAGAPAILGQSVTGLAQPLFSNETSFTVVEPSGPDLVVWNAIRDRGGVDTCSQEIAELIWQQYPSSGYAAYCVRDLNHADPLKQIAGYEAALAKQPPAYRTETYRLNMALAWINRGWGLITRDVKDAVDAYDRARALLEPLSRNAISEQHRKEAARLLRFQVLTAEQVAEQLSVSRGYDSRPIIFGLTCYEKLSNGLRKVWFGYNNPNSKEVNIPVGNDNKFTPPPFDRNQPTNFKAGNFVFAFNVLTKEPALVWHLQGKTAQFKLPDAIECPTGYDPNDPATWQVEE